MSKKTKKVKGSKPEGQSKYTLKLAKRRKAAVALGLPANTPWPVIWANQR